MKKILIVDDEAEIRDLVERTLHAEDRTVLKAENGGKAVEIACAEKPDLIMMDIMMPGSIDGLEATRILKADAQTRDCVVVILTGRDEDIDRERGLKAGADDYLVKPFSPLELMRKVDDVLEGGILRRRAP